MTQRRTLRSETFENETLVTRARVVRDSDGTGLLPGDVTAWSLRVFDLDGASGAIYSIDSNVASLVITSNYRTSGWDEDSTGYNFAHAIASSAFAREGGNLYRLEYLLTTVSDGVDPIVHESRMLGLYGV